MPASNNTPNDYKEFDARTVDIVVADGSPDIEDVESIGFNQSKDHDLQYTLDQNAIWVKSTPELTGSFVLKASSPSAPELEQMFMDDEVFDIQISLADDAYGGDADDVYFMGCMITDFDHSDYQIDGMPTISVDFQAVNQEA